LGRAKIGRISGWGEIQQNRDARFDPSLCGTQFAIREQEVMAGEGALRNLAALKAAYLTVDGSRRLAISVNTLLCEEARDAQAK
jgi:hypothetical protein